MMVRSCTGRARPVSITRRIRRCGGSASSASRKQSVSRASPPGPRNVVTSTSVSARYSRAVTVVGLTKDTPPPPGGKILLDDNGQPTGVIEDSNALLLKFVPARSVSNEKYEEFLVTLLKREPVPEA